MQRRIRTVLRNPLVVIVPIVLLGLWGWRVYLRVVNTPNHAQHNLLYNGDFEQEGAHNIPVGWQLQAQGYQSYVVEHGAGYGGGTAMGIRLNKYTLGSLTLKSPAVRVQADTTYLYKGYYRSDVAYTLVLRRIYKDGTVQDEVEQQYPASSQWTTNSIALQADSQLSQVQILYRLASTGTLWLDRTYVDQRSKGVIVPDTGATDQPNSLKNAGLIEVANAVPVGWTGVQSGVNAASLTYQLADGVAFLHAQVTGYKNGEAKWEPTPVPVDSGKYFQLSFNYRGDHPAKVVAEYAMTDGSRQFMTIGQLTPAADWTQVRFDTEAPPGSTTLTVDAVLTSDGTLDTANYSLQDITKAGQRHFNRPLISITFDEGWDESYMTAMRIMGYLGYKGTFYTNVDTFDKPSFTEGGDLKQLLKNGNQLGSQGYEYVDLTTDNDAQLNRQLQTASDYLDHQYGLSNADFAPPDGLIDPEVQYYVRRYYRSSRGTQEGINTKQNFDAYNLLTLFVDKNTSPQRLQDAIDEAKRENGWLILAYHHVKDNDPSRTTVSPEAFANQLVQINKSGIVVKTVDSALNEIWNQ